MSKADSFSVRKNQVKKPNYHLYGKRKKRNETIPGLYLDLLIVFF